MADRGPNPDLASIRTGLELDLKLQNEKKQV